MLFHFLYRFPLRCLMLKSRRAPTFKYIYQLQYIYIRFLGNVCNVCLSLVVVLTYFAYLVCLATSI